MELDPKYQNESGKPRKIGGDRLRYQSQGSNHVRCFAWYQRKYRRLAVRWERQKVYFDSFIDLATLFGTNMLHVTKLTSN